MGVARKIQARKGNELPPDIPDIFEAAASDDVESLEIALAHLDVNSVDDNDMTALHHAAGNLSENAVNRLLEEPGIDPTMEDAEGRTASSMPLYVYGDLPEAVQLSDKLRPHCYPESWSDYQADDQDNGFHFD